jgi:hypothetical protein
MSNLQFNRQTKIVNRKSIVNRQYDATLQSEARGCIHPAAPLLVFGKSASPTT